jgi:nitrogen fixation protein NifT
MKVMIRKSPTAPTGFAAYIAKKDLEEPIVAQDTAGLWGGRITLGNGWVFELPALPPETALPLTVEARRLETAQ